MSDSSPSASANPHSLSRDAAIRAALALQRLLTLLPWPFQRSIGGLIGWISLHSAKRRREIARRNLALCFPDLTATERESLLKRHFRSLGIGLMEMGMAWWASDRRLRRLARIEGLENLAQARQDGRPVILIAGHFTTMDIVYRLLGLCVDYDGIHRPFGYPALDDRLAAGRGRAAATVYSKFDLRGILSALAAGRTIWMAVDQAQQSAGAVMAPFFGILAPTTGSPARLAARSAAAVLPVAGWREQHGHYHIRIGARLEGFPSGDAEADARLLNRIIEDQIRVAPEQYYWIHRRFKADPTIYRDL